MRGEGRLSRLRFDIVDRPGQLAAVVAVLSNAGANIVEVSHQRIFTDLPAKAVVLEVVIETRDRSHLASTIDALKAAGDGDSRIIVYPDAQHGFNADYRPSYNAIDAKEAWSNMLSWFKAHGVG